MSYKNNARVVVVQFEWKNRRIFSKMLGVATNSVSFEGLKLIGRRYCWWAERYSRMECKAKVVVDNI